MGLRSTDQIQTSLSSGTLQDSQQSTTGLETFFDEKYSTIDHSDLELQDYAELHSSHHNEVDDSNSEDRPHISLSRPILIRYSEKENFWTEVREAVESSRIKR